MLRRLCAAAAVLAAVTSLFALSAIPAQAATVVHVYPTTDGSVLKRALVSAGAGGTVVLHDGADAVDYATNLYVSAFDAATPVTVTCEASATIKKMEFVGSGHVTVSGCRLRQAAVGATAIAVSGGSHDLVFDGTVVDARGAKNAFATGSGAANTTIALRHVDFSSSSGDLVGAYNVDDFEVTDSSLHDPVISASTTDHIDAIQVTPTIGLVIARNRIWDNSIVSWAGPHQGIMLGGVGETADVTIAANVIGPWQGTGIVTSDQSSVQSGNGYIHNYAITNNTVTCTNGGVTAFWKAPSTAPSPYSGNSFLRYSAPGANCPPLSPTP